MQDEQFLGNTLENGQKKLFKNERQSAVQGVPFIYGENGITIMKLSLRVKLCISEW